MSDTRAPVESLTSDSHVTEEEPSSNERFVGLSGWSLHDVEIRGVKAQSRGWQTVSDQVDPQELHGNESLGQAKSSSQENTESQKESVRLQ